MTNQEILTKAITKAIAGGWHHFGGNKPDIIIEPTTYLISMPPEYRILIGPRPYSYANHSKVIFNHDFAKALWGDKFINPVMRDDKGSKVIAMQQTAWRHHLRQMVIAEDPITYLGAHLDA